MAKGGGMLMKEKAIVSRKHGKDEAKRAVGDRENLNRHIANMVHHVKNPYPRQGDYPSVIDKPGICRGD